MGRSVYYPSEATDTVYTHGEWDGWAWDDFVDEVRYAIKTRYPSFDTCERWMDREGRIILAIAHDVMAGRGEISKEWTGLEAQDGDQLLAAGIEPDTAGWEAAENAARTAYIAAVS